MTELDINDDNFDDLDNYDYLSITKLNIEAPTNINLLLDKLYKFINLKVLYLSDNKITKIKGLDKLINLQRLNLYNNQITEIEELDKLVNLKELYLHYNQIIKIKGLNKLTNLQY